MKEQILDEGGNVLCPWRRKKKSCTAFMSKLRLQAMNKHCYKCFTVIPKARWQKDKEGCWGNICLDMI